MPGESRSAGIQTSLLSPLLTETESPFDLEQQWQDLMSIMEMQVSSSWGLWEGVCPSRRVLPLPWIVVRRLSQAPDSWTIVVWGWSQLLLVFSQPVR